MLEKFLHLLMLQLCLLIMPSIVAQSASDIRLSLHMDDTVYFGQMVKVWARLESDRFFPQTIELNNFVAPSRHSFNYADQCVYLIVEHDGLLYEETTPVLIIYGFTERMKVSRFRPIKSMGLFRFDHMLPYEMVNSCDKEESRKARNRDFGEYQIQAVFVSKENDTIRSEPIKIMYNLYKGK